MLPQVIDEGHEVGVHGFDHYWWAENVFTATRRELRSDMEMGLEALRRATGSGCFGMGVTELALQRSTHCRSVDEFGFRYGADTRGISPFVPRLPGYSGSDTATPDQFAVSA